MRLYDLDIRNFKEIRKLSIGFNGQDALISGWNGTGKTSVAGAFTWLLSGRDFLDSADFQIKPLSSEGEPEHALEHEVSATLDMDGSQLILRKVLTESWVKPRGKAEAVFSGHTVKYFLDGVPTKERDYLDRIAAIAPAAILKPLVNPSIFSKMKWQDLRKLLLSICGDITDQDVIDSDPKLAALPEILGKHPLENYRKILAGRKTEINGQLNQIPVRISEQTRVIVDAGVQPGPIRAKLAELEPGLSGYRQQLATLESGGAISEKKQQLAELATQIIEAANLERQKVSNSIHAKTGDLQRAQSSWDILTKDRKKALEEIETSQGKIAEYESDMAKLRAKWSEVDAANSKVTGLCPTCEQPYPQHKVDSIVEKFNLEKAEKLKDIVSNGKTLKTFCDRLTTVIADLSKKLPDLEGKIITAHGAIETIQRELADLEVEKTKPLDSEVGGPIVKQKMDLEAEIVFIQGNRQGAIDEIKGKIEATEAEIKDFNRTLIQIEANETAQKRIAELKREERSLAAEFERAESELFLTEQFVRAKVSMLDAKINSRFQYARFKMFDLQVNGALQEVCEIVIDGKPPSNGQRINAEIDIANVLAEHHGLDVPMWLDNVEAVNEILPSKQQQIKLRVTSDLTLKITMEKENERRAA